MTTSSRDFKNCLEELFYADGAQRRSVLSVKPSGKLTHADLDQMFRSAVYQHAGCLDCRISSSVMIRLLMEMLEVRGMASEDGYVVGR